MIRLVSLNIERSKHLDLVIPFLQEQRADVVCLQELMERDIPTFSEALGSEAFFSYYTTHPAEGRPGRFGTGIFSRSPAADKDALYYWGDPQHMRQFDLTNARTKRESECRAVSFVDLEKDGERFRIATTHFTWTPDGNADDNQRADMNKLLTILAGLGEFVLSGDFNAPRGGEIFSMLAQRYKDNIPSEYKTSIDLDLHRAAKIASEHMDEKMVDGLFSTPQYAVSQVELHVGISDHLAITATISRVESA
ncbi:MAG TPA: endonuclease/exonuclease/phosphatase family protein [Candidatus Paceibacterota bacterium]|jgi:endonuclease/exonuclease/phosphatase family metal-dependent hydrolase|nr:endonuclease/exonuclease/phosphatase family protein [Candidatus Paceibacterota bacterium]